MRHLPVVSLLLGFQRRHLPIGGSATFRFGWRPAVLLAAILTLLALSTSHNASALTNGSWAAVFSYNTTPMGNAGDCEGSITGPDAALVDGGGLWNCKMGGAPLATNGVFQAALTGLSIAGTISWTGLGSPVVTTFTGTVSSPVGSSFAGGWTGGVYGPGTYSAALQQTTTGSGQTVTFSSAGVGAASLTGAVGQTAIINAPTAGGPLPPQFQLLGGQYYHVVTTNTGTGPYTFCVNYSLLPFATATGTNDMIVTPLITPPTTDENFLQILHLESGTFVPYPRSAGTDPSTNIVCALTTSLSEFALVAPTSTAVGGLVSIVNGDSSSGLDIWLWAVAITGSAIVLVTGAWVGKRRRRLD